jgi:hypothetical protein
MADVTTIIVAMIIVAIIAIVILLVFNAIFLYSPVNRIETLANQTAPKVDTAIAKIDAATAEVTKVAETTARLETKIDQIIQNVECGLARSAISAGDSAEFCMFFPTLCTGTPPMPNLPAICPVNS